MPKNFKGRKLILTYAGRAIDPMRATEDDIDLTDIAHSTANLCRYTGHVRKFYSVAEHSVRVSEYIERETGSISLALTGLMHDASEAYLGDVARPVKDNNEVGRLYKLAEDKLMKLISKKFGTEWPLPEIVGFADYVLLRTEQRDLMPYPNDLYSLEDEPTLDKVIEPWGPEKAERKFLERYEILTLEAVLDQTF